MVCFALQANLGLRLSAELANTAAATAISMIPVDVQDVKREEEVLAEPISSPVHLSSSQLADHNKELQEVVNMAKRATERVEKLEKINKQLEEQNAAGKAKYDATVKETEFASHSAQTMIDELSTKVSELKEQKVSDDFGMAMRQIDVLSAKVKQGEEVAAAADAEGKTLRDQLAAAKKEAEEATSRFDEMMRGNQKEAGLLRKELEALKETTTASNAEAQAEAKVEVGSLRKQVAEAAEAKRNMVNDLLTMANDNRERGKRAEELKKTLKELQEQTRIKEQHQNEQQATEDAKHKEAMSALQGKLSEAEKVAKEEIVFLAISSAQARADR